MPLQPSTWNADETTVHQVLYSDTSVGYSVSNVGYSGGTVPNTTTYTAIPEQPSSFTATEPTPSSWVEV
jgi:hypothetical protein